VLECFLRRLLPERSSQLATVPRVMERSMATYTPPPYFPQSSLSPPDKSRYRKFKLAVLAGILLVLVLVGGGIWGLVYLLKLIF
jgi:hypothetical protein